MNNTKKVVAIIQARSDSSRLPKKVMRTLFGKTVLTHDIERVKQSKNINEIVIATTIYEIDDVIVEEAKINGVKFYRGSEDDVLDRYYNAALDSNADVIVRITSDCPLIDPYITEEIISFYLNNDYDLVTNSGDDLSKRTYPRGLDVEVFSFEILEKAHLNADKYYQREHVTPYIYENSKNIYYYKNNANYSKHRWTIDTEEDFELIEAIYEELYNGKHDFYFNEILNLFDRKPQLFDINKHVEQKKLESK